MKKQPKVNEVNEFLEIASDFEDPLEVVRESLSNAYDANATEVKITIRTGPNGSDIIIEDDGDGMDRRDLESFFDLGNSRKTDAIGYKGHGTKIFYKSDRIEVNTTCDGSSFRAVMEEPWRKLNDKELPEYELTETEVRSGNSGTRIQIHGFRSGQGFEPESLTYNKIEHYLKWKTIAGSTAHYFDHHTHEMEIEVDLDEEIDNTQPNLTTNNRLEFPPEQVDPDDGQFPAEHMCRHYGPKRIDIELSDGSTTELEIIGMVAGKAARNELPTYGRHSSQFGVWLAKDHIKVERLNETISADNEFLHFLFVANCQDIELSANREKIRNKSTELYQVITEEIDHFMSKVTEHPWFREYLEIRRNAELDRRASSHSESIDERRKRLEAQTRFVPSNPSEVIAALERSNQTADHQIRIAEFVPSEDINAIVESTDGLAPASVQVSVTDILDEELPLLNTETVVCWDYGDRDRLRQIEREGYLGGDITVDFESDQITYRNGSEHRIDIVRLEARVE